MSETRKSKLEEKIEERKTVKFKLRNVSLFGLIKISLSIDEFVYEIISPNKSFEIRHQMQNSNKFLARKIIILLLDKKKKS